MGFCNLSRYFCRRHLLLHVRKLGGFLPSQFDHHNCSFHNQYLDIRPSQPLEAIKLQSNKEPSSKFNWSIPYAVRILTHLRPSVLVFCKCHPCEHSDGSGRMTLVSLLLLHRSLFLVGNNTPSRSLSAFSRVVNTFAVSVSNFK
mmetsp:Transcript_45964/g.85450  ORF Transcript_45964/g.85450 Transcript_45964/m.85450 type:complete len:144 (-) Transcript_45964:51-482(-)